MATCIPRDVGCGIKSFGPIWPIFYSFVLSLSLGAYLFLYAVSSISTCPFPLGIFVTGKGKLLTRFVVGAVKTRGSGGGREGPPHPSVLYNVFSRL